MLDKLNALVLRWEDLEAQLSDPAVYGDTEKLRNVNRELQELGPVVETYQAYADYNDVMEMVEELYAYVARNVFGATCVPDQGHMIELKAPWRRVTMAQAVRDACGVDFFAWHSDEEARACLDARGVHAEKDAKRGDCLAALFDEYVEATLIQPTFVTDFPVDI